MNKKSKYNYLYRLASLASKSQLEIYLSAGVDIFEDYENNITADFDYLTLIKKDFDVIASSKLSGLKKIMNMDFDTNLFGDLLVKMDIATMANSLEGRSPFLSKELLEYVPAMNDKFKINGGTTKYLLRHLAKKYLPEALANQPKRGFEIPLKSWAFEFCLLLELPGLDFGDKCWQFQPQHIAKIPVFSASTYSPV